MFREVLLVVDLGELEMFPLDDAEECFTGTFDELFIFDVEGEFFDPDDEVGESDGLA